MTEEICEERRKLIHADEQGRYKVFRVLKGDETCSNKEVWVCCCGKEFKQHKRFHEHNCSACKQFTPKNHTLREQGSREPSKLPKAKNHSPREETRSRGLDEDTEPSRAHSNRKSVRRDGSGESLSEYIWGDGFIQAKHIKEFIKKLKESLCHEAFVRDLPFDNSSLDRVPMSEIIRKIDKIFGKELTG